MPTAEIITIGTEILLGEIVDTNAQFIARKLRDAGIDLYRKTTVGDNPRRIAQAIRQAMEGSEIILTTGGLGPTVDDPTREAVALALDRETEFRPELWEQIQARFQRFGRQPTENNRRQAYIPCGALAVENPVGTAPSFIVEHEEHAIIALPGVPREMEHLLEHAILPYLRQRYQLTGIIKARVLHTAGVGESQIDDLISDLEALNNPTIGLAAHSGQVDVRITAKAESEARADELIQELESEVRRRLGYWVYGADQETLEEIALQRLQYIGWTLAVVETGLGGELVRRLSNAAQAHGNEPISAFRGGEVMAELPTPDELHTFVAAYRQARQVEVCLGVAIYPAVDKQDVHLVLITPEGEQRFNRPYGGPPGNTPRWALHHSLDLLRRL
ncbi:MAG: CinA family nicotinamide mononucleotide deamidase-related protein [Anaerolineales bacterium]|nr:CinA family nicotinamide mononucleotide deamidase-related protein [Anaerolineales bacterium]